MSATYTFTYNADAKVILAGMKVSPPPVKIRGQRQVQLLKLLHCVLLGFGALGIGYGLSELLTGTPTLMHWGTVLGMILFYIAVFGSIFITMPTLVRQSLATRANQGALTMTVDADGVRSHGTYYKSNIQWAGMEGIRRSKLGLVLLFGGNRPSIPFTAFEGPAQIDAFEEDVQKWIEASR